MSMYVIWDERGRDIWRELDYMSVVGNIIGMALKASDKNYKREIPSVFISYASEERQFTRRLVSDLRRRRTRVWFDQRLKSGATWLTQLATAIEASDALLVVLSPASVCSEYVRWELDTARILNKKIYPIMYQECEAPSRLQLLQQVDLSTDYEKGWSSWLKA